jgi:hypothetical protein
MSVRVRLIQAMLSGLLVVGSAARAGAVDRFVAPTGSDTSNDCLSSASPCLTIQRAVSQAASGDTLEIAKGRYRGPVPIGGPPSITLTLQGGWSADFGARDVEANKTAVKGGIPSPVFDVTAGAGGIVDVTLDGLTISNSTGFPNGGWEPGIFARSMGDGSLTLTVSRCNLRASRGGGISAHRNFTSGGSLQLTVADSMLKGNRTGYSGFGGGISASGSVALTVTRSVFVRNRAQSGGGAIDFEGISLTVADSIFLRNRVVDSGFLVNSSPQGGGGILVFGALPSDVATFTNNFFAGNTAKGDGGALWIYAGSPVDITNCTLARNTTKMSGGGLHLETAGSLTNTIAWGNKAAMGTDVWAGGATLDLDHDDIGELATGSTVVNDLGGNINTDPLLVAPPKDLHLTAGSPCIDAGTCTGPPPTDIEGDPRPSGAGCDIGADEFVP